MAKKSKTCKCIGGAALLQMVKNKSEPSFLLDFCVCGPICVFFWGGHTVCFWGDKNVWPNLGVFFGETAIVSEWQTIPKTCKCVARGGTFANVEKLRKAGWIVDFVDFGTFWITFGCVY